MKPSKYKPPKPVTQKTLREIAPPNISLPLAGACTWKIGLKYKAETVNLLPNNIIRLAQSILKRKSPSKKKDPQKGPLKNISPWTYFRNFTVFQTAICTEYYIGGEYKSKQTIR